MITVRGKRISTLYSAEQIAERNAAMAAEMHGHQYHDLLVIAVLKGSFIFAADLIRAMHGRVHNTVQLWRRHRSR
jgi:hypoxanthine phosphoribosyltransferase